MSHHRLFLKCRAAATLILASLVLCASKAEPNAAPHSAGSGVKYTGVNLASGGFGKIDRSRYGYDYIYPTKADAAPFLAAGMNTVRLPFRWYRLQPVPMGPLDPTELARLDKSVAEMKGFALIILDLHDYASYRRDKLGTPQAPARLLPDVWRRLAQHYSHNPNVAFGIMNEPNGINGALWRDIAQKTLNAIRATGARNLVLVPGANWTGVHSWTAKGAASNGALMADLNDPADNMAFEMHEYPDQHSSGTGGPCVSPEKIAARFANATAWLREHHAHGFLGEFGAPPSPDCLIALKAMVQTMDDASDVWLGWTYWAAGARWGDYPYSIQPNGKAPRPQMQVLQPFIAH